MSALADFAHKFGSESRELKIGQSFFNDEDSCFHTIRYDFVPASVDPNKTSAVDFGSNGKVRVTIPNLEGSGTGRESVYQGMRKPHQKECVLIFNHETGEVVLEKLNSSMIVKKARLRQEDMTGKSFALNNHPNNNHKATHSNGLFPGPSGSQSKSSIHSDKAKSSLKSVSLGQSMPNMAANIAAKLPCKTSSPLSSSGITAPRSNGFQPKTPSPPSMPIFSANKGSLLHPNGPHVTKAHESAPDWSGGVKSKETSALASSTKLRHKKGTSQPSSSRNLSEESSSDSEDEDSESSSQSSDSSSEDEKMRQVGAPESSSLKQLQSSAAPLSMPSFSVMAMPSALGALSSGPDSSSRSPNIQQQSSANHHAKSPPESAKKVMPLSSSALPLSLSDDSDDSSDDDQASNKSKGILSNGSNIQQKKDFAKGGSPLETLKSTFSDSMPKFTSNGTAPAALPNFSMPKFSQLSQDLQLSESSGSDSDD